MTRMGTCILGANTKDERMQLIIDHQSLIIKDAIEVPHGAKKTRSGVLFKSMSYEHLTPKVAFNGLLREPNCNITTSR